MKDENQNSHRVNEMPSKWKKMARKRWVFPAVYLGFAAIVLAAVLWMQGGTDEAAPNNETDVNSGPSAYNSDQEAVPVTANKEVFKEPFAAETDVEVKMPFYDVKASAEEQETALVFYNNSYYQNQGIDYATKSGEPFDVTAAMSGNVVKSEKDPILGHVVEIEHEDGVTTIYQSLENVAVSEGDKVLQGDVIGSAGHSVFNKDAGVHAHFEIRKDGIALNPIDYFEKSVASLADVNVPSAEQQATEEESAHDHSQEQSAEPSEEQSAEQNQEQSQEQSAEPEQEDATAPAKEDTAAPINE